MEAFLSAFQLTARAASINSRGSDIERRTRTDAVPLLGGVAGRLDKPPALAIY